MPDPKETLKASLKDHRRRLALCFCGLLGLLIFDQVWGKGSLAHGSPWLASMVFALLVDLNSTRRDAKLLDYIDKLGPPPERLP